MPTLLGFVPQRDIITGEVKKSLLAANANGTRSFPLVVRCNKPQGCFDYAIHLNQTTFSAVYIEPLPGSKKDYKTLVAYGLSFGNGTSDEKTRSPLNAVFIPEDSNGNEVKMIDNVNSMPFGTIDKFVGSTKKKFRTYYGDVIAVLYIDSARANNLSFQYNSNGWENKSPYFSYASVLAVKRLIIGTPYITNGFVWKYVDSAAGIGAGTSWSQHYSVSTGTSKTQTMNNSIQIGLKVTASTPDTFPVKVSTELSTNYSTSWGTEYSVVSNSSSTSALKCDNSSGSLNSQKICAVYQLYGTTMINVPGISDRNLFAEFNNNTEHYFALSVGIQQNITTDDSQMPLGVLYPIAGTIAPEKSLNLAFPTAFVQY